MRTLRSLCILALLALLTTAATCDGPRPLDLDDKNRFTPGGRVSYEILPGNAQRRRGAVLDLVIGPKAAADEAVDGKSKPPERPVVQGTLSVDGEFAHATAHDRQFVSSGDDVRLGGRTISGPATVKMNAEASYGHVAGRGGLRILDMIGLEGIVGVGINRAEMGMRSAGGLAGTNGETRAGFLFGGRATVRPIPLFDLYLQYTINMLRPFDSQARDLAAGVDLNLTRNVSLYGGYHSYRYYEDNDNASDIRIHLEGPTAGVSLKF